MTSATSPDLPSPQRKRAASRWRTTMGPFSGFRPLGAFFGASLVILRLPVKYSPRYRGIAARNMQPGTFWVPGRSHGLRAPAREAGLGMTVGSALGVPPALREP